MYLLAWSLLFPALLFAFLQLHPLPTSLLSREIFTLFVLTLGSFSLPVLHVLALVTRHLERRPLVSLGLPLGRDIFKGVLQGAAFWTLVISLLVGLSLPWWDAYFESTWNPRPLTPQTVVWIFLLVIGWFGVAFWEELVFRGYMLQTFLPFLGPARSILVSALSFSSLHVVTYGISWVILLPFLLGILLATLYLKTRSLWVPIGVHCANNFLVMHILPSPYATSMKFPLITVNGEPLELEPLQLLFQVRSAQDVFASPPIEILLFSLSLYLGLSWLIWKLPWFRPHPEMEALWQQYVQPRGRG